MQRRADERVNEPADDPDRAQGARRTGAQPIVMQRGALAATRRQPRARRRGPQFLPY